MAGLRVPKGVDDSMVPIALGSTLTLVVILLCLIFGSCLWAYCKRRRLAKYGQTSRFSAVRKVSVKILKEKTDADNEGTSLKKQVPKHRAFLKDLFTDQA